MNAPMVGIGETVSDSESYAYRLQQMLPRAEIMNLGVHGYAHDQMLILFKDKGSTDIAGNYSFNSSTTTTADITARALMVTATGVNRVYDGTTTAEVLKKEGQIGRAHV